MALYNLPQQATPFVGRLTEIAEITRRMNDPDCRLLTLVGPGGIGKTRLAIQVAMRTAEQFANGACFVPLQPLNVPDFIVATIAEAVSLQFHPSSDPKQQLLDYFREKALLLVLDNFEHLLEGVAILSEILSRAPHVRILTTSRERLNLLEEWVYDVRELSYPTNEAETDIESFDAVQLFVQHSRRMRADFALTSLQKPSVIRICRLVGGMPLGIELAAAWIRALSCDQIASELARSLNILETPARNVEPRHRAMRVVFEPTWKRLSESERTVFAKLSVFRGGFTRDAAEQVAGASLNVLSALVDKSLLRVDANGRYDMHELLRQYAAEMMTVDESNATADRHLTYFADMIQRGEAHLFGHEQTAWFDRIETEFDNVRTAMTRSLHGGDAEKGLQLAAALGWFFSDGGYHWREGRIWLERTLAASPKASVSLRAKALHSGAAIAENPERARALCEQALILARAAGDRWNTAWALSHLGYYWATSNPQESEQATDALDESLLLFRQIEDPMGLAHTLIRRTVAALRQRDYPHVRALLEEAWTLAREVDDKIITAWIHGYLGEVAWLEEQNIDQAKMHFEMCLSLFREVQFEGGARFMRVCLAQAERATGNYKRAQALYEKLLVSMQESSSEHENVDVAIAGLAGIAAAQGKLERAARLLGAVNRSVLPFYWSHFPEIFNFDNDLASVRAQLGDKTLAAAWAVGQVMTREQVIAYALQESEGPLVTAPSDGSDEETLQQISQETFSDSLTERELEILRLVANGFSNREIARKLIFSLGTVKWYLHQIYSKLGVSSRTQAVARARELNLPL